MTKPEPANAGSGFVWMAIETINSRFRRGSRNLDQ